MNNLGLAIHGAAGRMGQRLVALASVDEQLKLVAAFESAEHPRAGEDAGSVAGIGTIDVELSPTWSSDIDVVVDFSVPAGAESITQQCLANGTPLVVATTGLSSEQQDLIRLASEQIPIVWAPSMSTAVNLVMKLAQTTAAVLKDVPGGADVEILERHHRFKEDAPSGTALRFGELIGEAMGISAAVHGRQGQVGAREHNEIAYHAIRTGDNPGEHTIVFGMLGETIELTVRASNRDSYALGALTAAKFVAAQSAGLYSMNDVLGL